MSPLSTFIVITLGIMAIFDIIVGVANDAVNFLNSAFGSKIASRRTVLIIAAIGILVGTLTSSGMMEVARSGVFYPGQFTFEEIMMLFLGMIVGDILLLDLFNTLGLPTSTTVSMVFGLLGAAVGIALHRIAVDPAYLITDMSMFINSNKAMAIISAILLSVVLSFAFGAIFMYISRLIFSFRFHKVFSRFGALWCGISFAGIIYFSIFKGLKNSGLIPAELTAWISDNTMTALLIIWLAASAFLYILAALKVSVLKITILAGTFSLALAFAGNDLVNFIGVPLAGMESYKLSQAAGGANIMMGALAEPAKANFLILAAAGVIMVLTLFFSKKAMKVTKTELDLSDQNEGQERFGSSFISRGIVRGAIAVNNGYTKITPMFIQRAIESRFEPLSAEERTDATYDLIRATVNLTAASILISIATSYKLPLSTTYVVFMVAMGSSLADRAWGRESAVYRITGVMTVVAGWFLTAFSGFTIALIVSTLLIWGGWIATVIIVTLTLYIAIKSNFIKKKKDDSELESTTVTTIDQISGKSVPEVITAFNAEIGGVINDVNRIYSRTLVALSKENRKVLKAMASESDKLYKEARTRKTNIVNTLRILQDNHVEVAHFYVQTVDYLSEVTKALMHITHPAYEHINNNHEGQSREQVSELKEINDLVEQIFDNIEKTLNNGNYAHVEEIFTMRDELFEAIAEATKKQVRRVKDSNSSTPTRCTLLYLTMLTETKTMVLQSRNILKSQRDFMQQIDKK